MTKPSESQLAILTAAAKKPTTDVREFMTHIKIRAVHEKVFQVLLKNGWIEEVPGDPDLSYFLTDAGRKLAGVKYEKKKYTYPKKPADEKAKASTPAPKSSKQQIMIDLLKRKQGATLLQMSEATDWELHSVRGAIAGVLKKKLGLNVTSSKAENGNRVYRIA